MDKKEIKVMFREDCLIAAGGGSEVYGIEGFDKPTAIISIFGTDEKIPEILNTLKEDKNSFVEDVLFLQFDDIEWASADQKLMTLKDAMKISLFVDSLPKEVEQIVVHCSAGYSRSPAVANGILKFYGEEPKFIPPQYRPNEYCTEIMGLWIDSGMVG